jgi:hypothetical protein
VTKETDTQKNLAFVLSDKIKLFFISQPVSHTSSDAVKFVSFTMSGEGKRKVNSHFENSFFNYGEHLN